MTEIVNLNKARKGKLKQKAAQLSAENRARHGRTKAERKRDNLVEEQTRRALDNARKE